MPLLGNNATTRELFELAWFGTDFAHGSPQGLGSGAAWLMSETPSCDILVGAQATYEYLEQGKGQQ